VEKIICARQIAFFLFEIFICSYRVECMKSLPIQQCIFLSVNYIVGALSVKPEGRKFRKEIEFYCSALLEKRGSQWKGPSGSVEDGYYFFLVSCMNYSNPCQELNPR
jgi:hypothetical protein